MLSVRTILGSSGSGSPLGGVDVSSDTVTMWGTYRPSAPFHKGWSAATIESGCGKCTGCARGMLAKLRFPGGEGGSSSDKLKLGGGVRGSVKDAICCRCGGEETGDEVESNDPLSSSLVSCWFCSISCWLSINSIALSMPSGSQKSAHAARTFPLYSNTRGMIFRGLEVKRMQFVNEQLVCGKRSGSQRRIMENSHFSIPGYPACNPIPTRPRR